MIVILVGKTNGVFVFLSFLNTAGNAGQIVCSFVKVSIIQIVFLLEDVLCTDQKARTSKNWQSSGLTDGIVTARSMPNCPPTSTAVLRA